MAVAPDDGDTLHCGMWLNDLAVPVYPMMCTALGVGSLAGILFSRTAPVECFVVFFSWVVILLFSFFAPCTRIRTIISASRTFSLLIRYDGYLASRGDKFLGRQGFFTYFSLRKWSVDQLRNNAGHWWKSRSYNLFKMSYIAPYVLRRDENVICERLHR